jgi:hypothetical protein
MQGRVTMSYSALAHPASPYPALAQNKPPEKKIDPRVDKFHMLLLKAARDVVNNNAIIDSYKRFQEPTGDTIWYFTKVSILDGATKRPSLPEVDAEASVWEKLWKELPALSRQVVCDLAGQDPKKINFLAEATRQSLFDASTKWPEDLWASGQGARDSSILTSWTCSVFVGEALCQAARGLGLSDDLFMRKDKGAGFKFIAALNMRKSTLFTTVPKTDIKADGNNNSRSGYIVSMYDGSHVEIVTRIQRDEKPEYYCSIGAGRRDEAELGKEKCGAIERVWFGTADRAIDNDENFFLKINSDNASIKMLLAKI